tara:strand:+ start:28156 stop:28932 length:777 start_codon:yes stop_codon:yes gene_type:complete
MNKKHLPKDIHQYYEITIEKDDLILKENLCTDFEIKNIVQNKPDDVIFIKDDIEERIDNFLNQEFLKIIENEEYITLNKILKQSNFFVKQIVNKDKDIFLNLFNKHKKEQILKLKKEINKFNNKIELLNKLKPSTYKKENLPDNIIFQNLKDKTQYYVLTLEYTKDHFDFVLSINKKDLIPVKINHVKDNLFDIVYYLDENRRSEYTDLISEHEISSTGEVLLSDKMVFKTKSELENYLNKWKVNLDKRFERTIQSLY